MNKRLTVQENKIGIRYIYIGDEKLKAAYTRELAEDIKSTKATSPHSFVDEAVAAIMREIADEIELNDDEYLEYSETLKYILE